MALNPGGNHQELLSIEDQRLANNVFAEIVGTRVIPAIFTALIVDEIGIDGHKPVVKEVLARFGQYGNFKTEYNATTLPLEDQARISSRYKKVLDWRNQDKIGDHGMKKHYPLVMERFKKAPLNYSSRLHCLVMAHTPEWENEKAPKWDENSQAVYIFMSDMIGPKLKFDYNPKSAGDYNLIVAWAFKNVEMIKKLYFMKDDPAYIDTQLARGFGVELDLLAFENVAASLQSTTKFSLSETQPIGKLGLPIVELAVAPDTSIVWDFEKWFVNPDQHGGVDGFGDVIPKELKDQLGVEGIKAYCERLNFLSLINLSVLKDIAGKGESIKKLDSKLGLGGKLPEILREYLIAVKSSQEESSVLPTFRESAKSRRQLKALANMSQSTEIVNSMLNTIHPEWGNHTLASALKSILEEMSNSDHIGLGSGRALLVAYNERASKKGGNEKNLIQFMGMMVKLAKGDGSSGLDSLYGELNK